jgi:hypothetical protein
VWLEHVVDLAGNEMAPMVLSFTTGTASDLRALVRIAESPTAGATGVSTSAAIRVYFNKELVTPLDPASAFRVTLPSGQIVEGTLTLSDDRRSAVFQPLALLRAQTSYYVSVTITDVTGATGYYSFGFTTGSVGE